MYHRNYELQDPIEIRILPTSIEIISYNGADPSLKQADFDAGRVRTRRYRNRRVGEFLKELKLTEGRGTGIPTIISALKTNGSPLPTFDTNEPQRTHFILEIPIHEAFILSSSDQDTDQDADQDKTLLINELENIESFIFDDVYFSTDQDVDQDEKETKGMKFVISSSTLLKHLQQISKNIQNVNGDPLVYAKYKSTALDLTSEQASILNCAYSPLSNKELQEQGLKMKVHHDNFKNHIEPLLQRGFLERTIKDKPTSKYQKYFTTARGKRLLSVWNQIHTNFIL